MTNPDLDDPGALTLLAAVGWRLFPDPAAARELCKRLPADEIDKAARCLKLRKILRTLASRKLGVEAATDQFFEFQEGVATTVQRLSDRVKGGGLNVEFADEFWREITDVVARLNGREIEALPAQVKTELADGFGIAGLFYWLLDIATLLSGGPLNILEKEIDAAIDAAISEVCAGVVEGKLNARGYDPETKRRGPVPVPEFDRPPTLWGVLYSRIGQYKDVVIVREHVEESAEEALAVGAAVPAAEAPAAVQDAPGRPETAARAITPAELADLESGPLGKWFANGWFPACTEAGFRPTREQDVEAAKQVLNIAPRLCPGDFRKLVRKAREVHAPGWTRGGQKGLDRKNNDYSELFASAIPRSVELWRQAQSDCGDRPGG